MLWPLSAFVGLLLALSGLFAALWCGVLRCVVAFVGLRFAVGLAFWAFRLVETAQVGVGQQVDGLLRLAFMAFLNQRLGVLAASVHLDDSPCAFGRNGFQVHGEVLIGGVGYGASQYVAFENKVFGIARVQRNLFAGHAFCRLHVVVYLVIKATFQLSAHARKLLWV